MEGVGFFPSVYLWDVKGRPSPATVYDAADTLHSCNIPICDAIQSAGAYVKIPAISAAKSCEFILCSGTVTKTKPPDKDKIKEVAGIVASDTKDHHRMSYGISYTQTEHPSQQKAAEEQNQS